MKFEKVLLNDNYNFEQVFSSQSFKNLLLKSTLMKIANLFFPQTGSSQTQIQTYISVSNPNTNFYQLF